MIDEPTRREIFGMIDALDKRIDIRLIGMGEALRLQTKEYERRLEDLNHSHNFLRESRADFVGREAYESWKERINQHLDNDKGRNQGISLMWGIIVVVVMIAVAVISRIIK